MATIFVSGIEFYGYHGVSSAEREVGRRFEVEVELEIAERASATDNVADTVDYGAVAALVVEIGQGHPHCTVERLARLMADRILATHPSVSEVAIEVSKLLPPIPAVVRAAGVRLSVNRSPTN
ncbi:MAG: dihydroneopterin aldolase [Fimbriimonadaceae bacterium]